MGAPTSYLTIAGNVIRNVISTWNAYGILINGGATNCVISNNVITMKAGSTGGGGIATENTAVAGCVISGNTMRGASSSQGTGINFAVATTYTVVSNNVINAFGTGMAESPSAASDHNTITGNTANNNGYGFLLVGSSGNTLADNTADSNNGDGFFLRLFQQHSHWEHGGQQPLWLRACQFFQRQHPLREHCEQQRHWLLHFRFFRQQSHQEHGGH